MNKNFLTTLLFFLAFIIVQNSFGQKLKYDPQLKQYVTPSGQPVIRCASVEMHEWRMEQLRQQGVEPLSEQDFENWLQKAMSKQKNQRTYSGIIQIPVVVHVVHNGEAVGTGTNISDAQVISQIEVLNEDFRKKVGTPGYNTNPVGADTQIEFVLAKRDPNGLASNGIDRYDGGLASWTRIQIEGTLKPATIWNPDEYMNMWTLQFGGGDASLLGYAQFPDGSGLTGLSCAGGSANTDGLVMGYANFGSTDKGSFSSMSSAAPYDKGRTATHEIGHGLGLRHIWGDGDCTVDDYISDTPTASAANYGCSPNVSCGSDDMIENYMDYTDDACMNIFTEEQKIRMRTVLLNSARRVSWLTSPALTAPSSDEAGITSINNPDEQVCSGTFTPSIQVLNSGSTTISSITILSKIDGSSVNTDTWTGSIAAGGSATVSLSDITVALGSYTYGAEITAVNGSTDTETSNNALSVSFSYTLGEAPPYSQDFEAATFPPTNWNDNNVGNSCYYWVNQSATGIDGSDTKAAFINHFNYTAGEVDELITPVIDLSDESNAQLQFDVAYAQFDNSTFETLKVFVSQDCGATWGTAVYNKSSSTLATVANQTSDWYPTSSTDWRTETIDLSSYIGGNIIVKFESTSGAGNNLFIDNVLFPSFKPYISFTSASSSYTEATSATSGCKGYTDVSVSMQIDNPPAGDALVTVSGDGTGSASNPADYEILTSMPITFTSGSSANQSFTIRIYDDASVESDETIDLSYTLSGTTNALKGATNQTHNITISDNDASPIDNLTELVIWSETFTSPTGWSEITSIKNGGSKNDWLIGQGCNQTITGDTRLVGQLGGGGSAACDYVKDGSDIFIHKTVDATNYHDIRVAFDWISEGTPGSDYGSLVYSTNGGTSWTVVGSELSGTGTTINSSSVLLPTSLDGTNFEIGWRWRDNGDNTTVQPALSVDNITVYGQSSGAGVATTFSQTSTEYLGPNDDVYFKDANGEVIARIQNTSSHDYGCTTVEIDRSGSNTSEFWSALTNEYLADKSILVTPTTNNTSGTYSITLYYTDQEITNWETATGKSRSILQVAKTEGPVSNITSANPDANGPGNELGINAVVSNFGTDVTIKADFATGFSGFGAGDPGPPPTPLPLELISFSGELQSGNTLLNWTSASEEKTDYIVIEHSDNGKVFNAIGQVKAAGYSTELKDYSFVDRDVVYGAHYYRLKIVDLDDSFEYSNIIQVFQTVSSFSIANLYPNPAKEQITVDFTNDRDNLSKISIINTLGKTIYSNKQSTIKGNNSHTIPLSAVENGFYILKLDNGTQQLFKRIIVAK